MHHFHGRFDNLKGFTNVQTTYIRPDYVYIPIIVAWVHGIGISQNFDEGGLSVSKKDVSRHPPTNRKSFIYMVWPISHLIFQQLACNKYHRVPTSTLSSTPTPPPMPVTYIVCCRNVGVVEDKKFRNIYPSSGRSHMQRRFGPLHSHRAASGKKLQCSLMLDLWVRVCLVEVIFKQGCRKQNL